VREMKNAYRTPIGKPERKRKLGRSIHRCDNNIKMYLMKIRFGVWGLG
jgi:hypothetical protein